MGDIAETLPPATQAFILDAAGYIAGIDAMVANNAKLAESITATTGELKAMEVEAAQAAEASAAAMGRARDARGRFVGGAGATGAGVGEQEALTEAERMAAEAAKLEAEMQADLTTQLKLQRDADLAAAEGQAALEKAYRTTTTSIIGVSDAQKAAITRSAEEEAAARKLAATQKDLVTSISKVGTATIVAGGAFAAYGVKAAGDYQAQILRLGTAAGATGQLIGGQFTGELKMASDGILKMSVDTATSTDQLTKGMYMVMSAGFHGADALKVLGAAAEGAKAENADLGDVTKALTTLLNDFYHGQTDKTIPAMNMMITAVSQGKMTMQDLAASLHSVLPVAAANNVSFIEVGAAIATMTAHGVTADLATQHLSNTIRNLANPSNIAATEMGRLGLSATEVSQNLKDANSDGGGLYGTLMMLQDAINAHMGPAGLVLTSALNKTKDATAAAKTEIAQMSPELRKLAQEFQQGTIGQKDFIKATENMQGGQANLAKQFVATLNKADGFAQALRNNRPLAQSVSAEWQKLTGGAVGLETALNLTGKNFDYFGHAEAKMVAASQAGGKHVKDWTEIQKTFNFQMKQMEMQVHRAAIVVGQDLIPKIAALFKFFSEHTTITKTLAALVAGFLALAAAVKVITVVQKFIEIVRVIKEWEIATKLLTAAQWLLNAAQLDNPIGLIIVAIAALVAGFLYLWFHVKGFRDFWISAWHDMAAVGLWLWHDVLEPAWHGIAAAAQWAWSNVIKPTFDYIAAGYRLVGAVVMWWWHNVVEPAYRAVAAYIQWWWGNAKPVFDHFVAGLHLIADVVLWWWHNVLEPAYAAVGQLIALWWNDVVKPAFGLFMAGVHLVADVIDWWWHSVVTPAFDAVKAVISAAINVVVSYFHLWVSTAKTVLSWFGNLGMMFWNYFVAAYNSVVSVVGKIFSFIAGIPGTVVRLLSSLYDDMLQIGKNIVIGIWNGLVSMGQWLWDQVSSWISSVIPGPIKHVLGISSPSKLMHTYGQNIGHGLAQGILSQHAPVFAAARGLAQAAAAGASGASGISIPTFSAAGSFNIAGGDGASMLGGSLAAQFMSTSSASGGAGAVQVTNVNVHLEVHGSVSAQRDIVRDVQQAILQTNMRNPANNLSLPTGR